VLVVFWVFLLVFSLWRVFKPLLWVVFVAFCLLGNVWDGCGFGGLCLSLLKLRSVGLGGF
jgi:hypothetical protein